VVKVKHLGTTLTSHIHEESRTRINSGNTCYH